jgi:AcrR family transcriptional regulator
MRSSDETRKRLIEAATSEFAAHGIAGARVDRIAANSSCNKQAIYAYFESKEGLFEAVYSRMVTDTIENVPIDARDLPGYAGRLFDRYREHPQVQRLAAWYQLERASKQPLPPAAVRAAQDKIAEIRAAQDAGLVTDRLPPAHLLALVLRMASVGVYGSPETTQSGNPSEEMRNSLVSAVAKLVAPRA